MYRVTITFMALLYVRTRLYAHSAPIHYFIPLNALFRPLHAITFPSFDDQPRQENKFRALREANSPRRRYTRSNENENSGLVRYIAASRTVTNAARRLSYLTGCMCNAPTHISRAIFAAHRAFSYSRLSGREASFFVCPSPPVAAR